MAPVKNETGKRYGKLLVLQKRLDREQRPNRAYWICQCDCGTVKAILGDHLRSGATISCSCVGQRIGQPKTAKPRKRRPTPISTKSLEIRGGHDDDKFISAHVYRVPRKLDMGPIVAAARAALAERIAA